MNDIEEIIKRTNLQQISAFLASGAQTLRIETDSYEERLRKSDAPFYDWLKEHLHSYDESNALEMIMSERISVYEKVYLELGLRAGVMLALQLTGYCKIPSI